MKTSPLLRAESEATLSLETNYHRPFLPHSPKQALNRLFLSELANRYDSEKRQSRVLSQMAEAATCVHLKKLLRLHAWETEGQVMKLQCVFEALEEEVQETCSAVSMALLTEAERITDVFRADSPALNTALVYAAQKIEHDEMAVYGALREWAVLMSHKEAALILEQLLDEEKRTYQSLIKMARFHCNKEALNVFHAEDFYCDKYGHEFAKVRM